MLELFFIHRIFTKWKVFILIKNIKGFLVMKWNQLFSRYQRFLGFVSLLLCMYILVASSVILIKSFLRVNLLYVIVITARNINSGDPYIMGGSIYSVLDYLVSYFNYTLFLIIMYLLVLYIIHKYCYNIRIRHRLMMLEDNTNLNSGFILGSARNYSFDLFFSKFKYLFVIWIGTFFIYPSYKMCIFNPKYLINPTYKLSINFGIVSISVTTLILVFLFIAVLNSTILIISFTLVTEILSSHFLIISSKYNRYFSLAIEKEAEEFSQQTRSYFKWKLHNITFTKEGLAFVPFALFVIIFIIIFLDYPIYISVNQHLTLFYTLLIIEPLFLFVSIINCKINSYNFTLYHLIDFTVSYSVFALVVLTCSYIEHKWFVSDDFIQYSQYESTVFAYLTMSAFWFLLLSSFVESGSKIYQRLYFFLIQIILFLVTMYITNLVISTVVVFEQPPLFPVNPQLILSLSITIILFYLELSLSPHIIKIIDRMYSNIIFKYGKKFPITEADFCTSSPIKKVYPSFVLFTCCLIVFLFIASNSNLILADRFIEPLQSPTVTYIDVTNDNENVYTVRNEYNYNYSYSTINYKYIGQGNLSPVEQIISLEKGNILYPQITIDSNILYSIWINNNLKNNSLYFTKSEDLGLSWSEPVLLSDMQSGIYRPRIVNINETLYVIWLSRNVKSYETQLCYVLSEDDGDHWSHENIFVTSPSMNLLGSKLKSVNNKVYLVYNDLSQQSFSYTLFHSSIINEKIANQSSYVFSVDFIAESEKIRSLVWTEYSPIKKSTCIFFRNFENETMKIIHIGTVNNIFSQVELYSDDGGTLYIIWDDYDNNKYSFFYVYSKDNGLSWSHQKSLIEMPSILPRPSFMVYGIKKAVFWANGTINGSELESIIIENLDKSNLFNTTSN